MFSVFPTMSFSVESVDLLSNNSSRSMAFPMHSGAGAERTMTSGTGQLCLFVRPAYVSF